MKAVLILLIGLSTTLQAQKLDTVTVNTGGTSYLIFNEPITLFNLGSKSYVGKVESERMLFVKAVSPNAEPTTLLVQAGAALFTGYVRYDRKVNRHFYDYRHITALNEAAQLPIDVPTTGEAKIIKMRKEQANTSLHQLKDGIKVECVQLFNDTQRTYLKFAVTNTTTVAFVLDFISFTYKEHLPRRMRNKVAPQFQEMNPDNRIEPLRVEAGRTEDYYFSMPLYSTTEKGYLEVIFREKAGARVIPLEIPAKKILDAPLL